MLMALFQNKESLSSNKTTRVCGQADKNVQLQARPRGLIGVRRDFNLLLHPIVIRRLTVEPATSNMNPLGEYLTPNLDELIKVYVIPS